MLVLAGSAERAACAAAESPLALAATPQLDRLAERGRVFPVRLTDEGSDPASAAPLLALVGLDPRRRACARAAHLALLYDVELKPGEYFASANFVALFRDTIADVIPGPFSKAELEVLFEAVAGAAHSVGFRLLPGTGTEHLTVAPAGALDPRVPCPEGHAGERTAAFEPACAPHALFHRLTREALDGHEINQVRRELGENGADMVWVWGPAEAIDPASKGPESTAAVGRDPLWQGVCRAAGIPVKEPKAPDPAALVRTVQALLRKGTRTVFVHSARGTRDALCRSRELRAEGAAALDELLVGPLARAVEKAGGRLLVISEVARDSETGRALSDPVPALLWGAGVEPLRPAPFTEAGAAGAGRPLEPGSGLLAYVRHL
ncbi:MAG: hypothetical protein O7C98_04100 [Planctomycetota bacterium]|nr:hypothetical protein [Planctomycetota bacterium]